VIEPNSTDDVAAALKAYSAQARAQNQTLKVRLTQRLFHSSAAFTCPAQSESLPQQGGAANPPSVLAVSIIQNTMSKVLSVDKEALQMRVQPGIHLWDLAQAAGAHGMTISVGSVPVFGGLTLGGTIAAGAHGSGDGPAAADTPMDMVREVVWVDAAGERHVATPASPEWNGLYGGLGLVGVMTEFLLQLNPPSHTRFKSLLKVSDKNMVQDLERILNEVRGAFWMRLPRGGCSWQGRHCWRPPAWPLLL
jgi:FAD/FMN-containing dehydrogenase